MGNSVYTAENGLMCNKKGTGILNLSLTAQHDRPQMLLYCTRPSISLKLYPLLFEITVTSREICIWG